MPQRITIEQAEAEGYFVDEHINPPFAYKGPRFAPTEKRDCFTVLEAKLLAACRRGVVALAAAAERSPEFQVDYEAMSAAIEEAA